MREFLTPSLDTAKSPQPSRRRHMHLLAFGINHHTAPVDVREKAAFAPERLAEALHEVTAHGAAEATILSTCNRTEIYCGLPATRDEPLIKWFCHYHRRSPESMQPYLYRHPDKAAVPRTVPLTS